jgi:hypothetical protein
MADSQSVCLGGESTLELVTRYYFLSESCCLVSVGSPLSSEKSKSKSHYDLQSFGKSVLVSGAHLGPATNFSFSLKFSSDSCGFVIF